MSSATAPNYDLVILGGGPAGCAAALAARRQRLEVLLVAGGGRSRLSPTCAGWVSPTAARTYREWGVDVGAHGVPFTGLRLWNWELSKRSGVVDPELSGWVVETRALDEALRAAAQAAGAHVRAPSRAARLAVAESGVRVELADGAIVAAKLGVIADGAASALLPAAQLAAAEPPRPAGQMASATLGSAGGGQPLDVVLGPGRDSTLATVARGATQTRVVLVSREARTPVTDVLAEFLRRAGKAGLTPTGGAPLVVSGPCLAGLALEFESHVGKRCLVAGDAGGFVSAFSNEGLYPALRSGWLAGQTAAGALRSAVTQDELASFSAAWRADFADYLRMPNTDLGLLLPMVFGNPQMSRRLARAFLLGHGF